MAYRGPNRPQVISDLNFVTTLAAGVAQTLAIPEGIRTAVFNVSTADELSVSLDVAIDTSPSATNGVQVATCDSITGATAIALADFASGYQEVSFTETKLDSDPTGLAADTAGFQFVDFDVTLGANKATGFVKEDGATLDTVIDTDTAGDVTVSYRKGDLLTFGDVVKAINRENTPCSATLVGDDIVISSLTTGSSSAIAIDDTNSTLFLALADYNEVPAATAGTTTSYTVDVDKNGDASPVTVSVTGENAQNFADLITEIEADLTGITVAIVGGDIRLTSDSTLTTSAIAITSDTLFSELSDYNAIESAVVAVQINYVMDVNVDGLGDINVSLNAGDFTTYTELAADIDTAIAAKAAAAIVGSTIKVTSDLVGAGSTVVITDTNLLSSLPEFLQLESAVDGNMPQANFIQNPVALNVIGNSTIDMESSGTPIVHVSFYG